MDLAQNQCTISIDRFDLPVDDQRNEEAFNYLRHAITNILTRANLLSHFFISGNSTSPNPRNKATFYISYRSDQLRTQVEANLLEEQLNEIGFPAEHIPPEYLCSISYRILKYPVHDPRLDDVVYELAVLYQIARDNEGKNPHTKDVIQTMDNDYSLWGKIRNFMEKAQTAFDNEVPFEEAAIAEIVNPLISSVAYANKYINEAAAGPDQTREYFITEACSAYQGYRFANAVYFFGHALSKFPEGEHNSVEYKTVMMYCIIAELKLGACEQAVHRYDQLMALGEVPETITFAIMQINMLAFYLSKENCASYCMEENYHQLTTAVRLANEARNAPREASDAFLLVDDEIQRLDALELLAAAKCSNSYNGKCKAIRRFASVGDATRLQACIELFSFNPNVQDPNPQKGYTALHLAIQGEHAECAWLLKLCGSSLDIATAIWRDADGNEQGGITALDLIQNSENPAIAALTHPYCALEIRPNPNRQPRLDEEELNGARAQTARLETLREALKLPPETTLIYVPRKKSIILPGVIIPAELTRDYINFCARQIVSTPALECYNPPRLSQLQDFIGHLPTIELTFTINFNIQAMQRMILQTQPLMQPNSAQFFAGGAAHPSQIHRLICNALAKFLDSKKLFNGGNIAVTTTANVNQIQITLSCKTSSQLNGFLQMVVAAMLQQHFNGFVTCSNIEEVRPEVDVVAVQEMVSPTT